VQDVPARDGRITLGQLLKLTGTVDRGSDVRPFLAAGRVRVNGVAETRRGRKLVAGDVVEASGAEPFRVAFEQPGD
jgi:ribosome-associated protein